MPVKLPSNLRGPLVSPYEVSTLNMDETVTLLEVINDMKGQVLLG